MGRAAHTGVTTPSDWWSNSYSHRLRVTIKNNTGLPLNDQLVTWDTDTVSPAVSIDASSLRVVEKTSVGGVDRAWDWRYPTEANRLTILPAFLSGSVITFKTLGLWQTDETRHFDIYWNSSGGVDAPSFSHLECVSSAWTVVITSAVNGHTYTITIDNRDYRYTATGADTTSTIASQLNTAINAGSIAGSSISGATLRVETLTPRNPNYVSSAWLTANSHMTTTSPLYFGMGRMGPEDTGDWPVPASTGSGANYLFGLYLQAQDDPPWSRYLGWGNVAGVPAMLRFLKYQVHGDGASYYASDVTISAVRVNGPTITVTGAIGTTRGAHGSLWRGRFTATFSQRFYSGTKTSNRTPASGPFDLMKFVNLCRVQLTWTCQAAYYPAGPVGDDNLSALVLFSLADTSTGFVGNATIVAPNNSASYYQVPGGHAPVSFGASARLSGIHTGAKPSIGNLIGTVFGMCGNLHAAGFVVHDLATSLPGVRFAAQADSSPYLYVGLTGLSSGRKIPAGATVTADVTFATSYTGNDLSTGDALLPHELCTMLQHYTASLPIDYTLDRYSASTPTSTLLSTSARFTHGIQWFQENAQALLGKANNFAFGYNIKTRTFSLPDDQDGSMGEAYKLAGLVLRYLRLHDQSLIALIELQVRYHIDLERDLVAWYGNWWAGATSYYWFCKTGTYYQEGGFLYPAVGADAMDPKASSYGPASDPVSAGVPVPGGVWKGPWRNSTAYTSKDWVAYTDTGGPYAGQTFWYQVVTGASPASGIPPSNSTGAYNTGWRNRNVVQYTFTYTVNQPRAATSTDQAHSVAIGLYHYLYLLRDDPTLTASLPPTWRVGDIVAGAPGDIYALEIAGAAVRYTQRQGDSALSIANGLAAAVHVNATIKDLGIAATVAPTARSSPGLAALYLTGCSGHTVTNRGATRPANCQVSTLRNAALALLKRMADYFITPNPNGNTGVAKLPVSLTSLGNLYNSITGTHTYPASPNGLTLGYINYDGNAAMPMLLYHGGSQYNGNTFGTWELQQISGDILVSDANSGCINLFQSIIAPPSPRGPRVDQAGVLAYLIGVASDTVSLDLGQHAWTWGSGVSHDGNISQANYPIGWNLRSNAPGNTALTQAASPTAAHGPYASDAHYIQVNDGGVRDQLNGRTFQRLALLCLLALINPSQKILVEMDGAPSPNANIRREIAITQLIDDLALTCSLYLVEPSTLAARVCANGALGTGTYSPWTVMSNTTGYGLFAVELWFLVQQRRGGVNKLPAYYNFPGE